MSSPVNDDKFRNMYYPSDEEEIKMAGYPRHIPAEESHVARQSNPMDSYRVNDDTLHLYPEESKLIRSEYHSVHSQIRACCALQVLVWIIGTQFLCLFGQHCGIDTPGSLGDPRTVPNGGIALLILGPIVTLIIIPTSLILASVETRTSARVLVVLATAAALAFLGLAIYFFLDQGGLEKWRTNDLVAQNYIGGNQSAVSEALKSNQFFGIFFSVATVPMVLLALVSLNASRKFPLLVQEESSTFSLLKQDEAPDFEEDDS